MIKQSNILHVIEILSRDNVNNEFKLLKTYFRKLKILLWFYSKISLHQHEFSQSQPRCVCAPVFWRPNKNGNIAKWGMVTWGCRLPHERMVTYTISLQVSPRRRVLWISIEDKNSCWEGIWSSVFFLNLTRTYTF